MLYSSVRFDDLRALATSDKSGVDKRSVYIVILRQARDLCLTEWNPQLPTHLKADILQAQLLS